jgi:hypothetical protein
MSKAQVTKVFPALGEGVEQQRGCKKSVLKPKRRRTEGLQESAKTSFMSSGKGAACVAERRLVQKQAPDQRATENSNKTEPAASAKVESSFTVATETLTPLMSPSLVAMEATFDLLERRHVALCSLVRVVQDIFRHVMPAVYAAAVATLCFTVYSYKGVLMKDGWTPDHVQLLPHVSSLACRGIDGTRLLHPRIGEYECRR